VTACLPSRRPRGRNGGAGEDRRPGGSPQARLYGGKPRPANSRAGARPRRRRSAPRPRCRRAARALGERPPPPTLPSGSPLCCFSSVHGAILARTRGDPPDWLRRSDPYARNCGGRVAGHTILGIPTVSETVRSSTILPSEKRLIVMPDKLIRRPLRIPESVQREAARSPSAACLSAWIRTFSKSLA
jgi:hypothetical protein